MAFVISESSWPQRPFLIGSGAGLVRTSDQGGAWIWLFSYQRTRRWCVLWRVEVERNDIFHLLR